MFGFLILLFYLQIDCRTSIINLLNDDYLKVHLTEKGKEAENGVNRNGNANGNGHAAAENKRSTKAATLSWEELS